MILHWFEINSHRIDISRIND